MENNISSLYFVKYIIFLIRLFYFLFLQSVENIFVLNSILIYLLIFFMSNTIAKKKSYENT